MDSQNLIPNHKDDQQAIERLRLLSFEQLQPIIPQLLTCFQDTHWSIAHSLADILNPFVDEIVFDIISILRTNDELWKFGILKLLVRRTKNPVLLDEITRIAKFPTSAEIDEEVNLAAMDILSVSDST